MITQVPAMGNFSQTTADCWPSPGSLAQGQSLLIWWWEYIRQHQVWVIQTLIKDPNAVLLLSLCSFLVLELSCPSLLSHQSCSMQKFLHTVSSILPHICGNSKWKKLVCKFPIWEEKKSMWFCKYYSMSLKSFLSSSARVVGSWNLGYLL